MNKNTTILAALAFLAGCAQHETPPTNVAEQHLRDQFCASTPVDYDQTVAVQTYGHSHFVVCE